MDGAVSEVGLNAEGAPVVLAQLVRKAFTIAELNRETGFSACSLRLWAAARHVTGFASLIDRANMAGIDPFVPHRKVTRRTGSAERLIDRCGGGLVSDLTAAVRQVCELAANHYG